MRELIRPTLFMLARLGLFLAVVTWIIGHVSGFAMQLPTNRGYVLGAGCDGKQFWVLVWQSQGSATLVFQSPAEGFGERLCHPVSELRQYSDRSDYIEQAIPGVSYSSSAGAWASAISHWLLATIFTAFNIVLHFIYRKRPEAHPCEN